MISYYYRNQFPTHASQPASQPTRQPANQHQPATTTHHHPPPPPAAQGGGVFPCVSICRRKTRKTVIFGAGFWQAGLALGCLKSGGHSATPGFVPPRCGSAVLRRDSVKTAVFRIPIGGTNSGDFLELIVGTISLRSGRFFRSFFRRKMSFFRSSCRVFLCRLGADRRF